MAQHRYFVRKDPDSCKVEWNEMSGTEFYAFIKSTESADRHFANMGDFTIEMPADEFENWTKDRNRCAYLNNLKNGVTILSLQEEYQSDSGILEEHIQDPSVDIEGDVISNIEKKNLRAAVQSLDQESRYIVDALYLSENRKSGRALAAEMGIAQTELQRRKKKILRNLKFLVFKSKKIQQ